jgi:multidrug resistance efflux pump
MTPETNSRPIDGLRMDVLRKSSGRPWRRYLAAAAVVVAVAGATLALRRIGAAAPVVDKATLWVDTVKRGAMVREIQGQGTLVPEDVRWLSAVGPARVEEILVHPGTAVKPDTVILVLANPDLELAALEAERQLASAQAELVNLGASLESQRLAQQSQVATLRSELGDARRRATADDDLAKRGFLSELERGQSRDHASELAGRLDFEQKRVEALGRGQAAQIAAQQQQVERLRSIAEVRRRAVDDLRVRALSEGVLQQLPLQVGQSVAAGALLAKVARPDRLKAEVRIPEVQSKDAQLGLPAIIDTHVGIVHGHVTRIDPAVQSGFVKVDVSLEGSLPAGARPDLSVAGIIELDRLDDVLYVGRPTQGQPDTTVGVFRLDPDGETAARTPVRFGRTSVKTIEVVDGLREGDRVILSEMSQWNAVDRVRLR